MEAQRKRIRTLEREKAVIQQRYQTTKASMAHGELMVRSLLSQVETTRVHVDVLQRELARQREELDAARIEGRCTVCLEDVANHVLVPCGHLALCQRCRWLASSRCPVCRQRVERVIRVFRP